MENNQQNQTNPTTPPVYNPSPVSPVKENSSTGSIIATIIIIAILILGGLYFWGKRIETQRNTEKIVSEMLNIENTAAVEASNIKNVSSDDSLDTIEADLGATDISSLDSEI